MRRAKPPAISRCNPPLQTLAVTHLSQKLTPSEPSSCFSVCHPGSAVRPRPGPINTDGGRLPPYRANPDPPGVYGSRTGASAPSGMTDGEVLRCVNPIPLEGGLKLRSNFGEGFTQGGSRPPPEVRCANFDFPALQPSDSQAASPSRRRRWCVASPSGGGRLFRAVRRGKPGGGTMRLRASNASRVRPGTVRPSFPHPKFASPSARKLSTAPRGGGYAPRRCVHPIVRWGRLPPVPALHPAGRAQCE
jgi:hypothetical protein